MSSDEDIPIEDISSSDKYVQDTEIKKNILHLTFPNENGNSDLIPKEDKSTEKQISKVELGNQMTNIAENLFASDSDSQSEENQISKGNDSKQGSEKDGNLLKNIISKENNDDISFSDSNSLHEAVKNDDNDIYIEEINQNSENNFKNSLNKSENIENKEDKNDFSSNSFDDDFASSEFNNSLHTNQLEDSLNKITEKLADEQNLNDQKETQTNEEKSINIDNQNSNNNSINEDRYDNENHSSNEDKQVNENSSTNEEIQDNENYSINKEKQVNENNSTNEEIQDNEHILFNEDKQENENNSFNEENSMNIDNQTSKNNSFNEEIQENEINSITKEKQGNENHSINEENQNSNNNSFNEEKQTNENNSFNEEKQTNENNSFNEEIQKNEENSLNKEKQNSEANSISGEKQEDINSNNDKKIEDQNNKNTDNNKSEIRPMTDTRTKKAITKSQYTIDDANSPVFNWMKPNKKEAQSNLKQKKSRQISPTKPTTATNKSHQSNMFITQVTSAVKQVDEERQKRVLEEEKRRKRIEAARRQKEEEDKKRIKQEEERISQYEDQKQREEKLKQEEMDQQKKYEYQLYQFDNEEEGMKNKKIITKPKIYQERKKMNFNIMQFAGISPSIPVTKQIDLSKYDYEDFDVSLADNIPEGLFPLLKHGHESIVFRALCGVSVNKYPKSVVSKILIELNKYLDMCVEKGLIAEASYVNSIIVNIKNERNEKKKQGPNSIEKINEKLQEAEDQFEQKKNNWENQKSIMQVDKQLQDEDLELRYQEESVKLDEEWNSEKMQQKFNKPSPMLIELRQHARSLLAAHRFDEAAQVAEEITKKEAEETEEAARRMNQAYQVATIRLREKFDQEKEAIDVQYQTKYSALIKAEEASLRPVSQRIDKYKNIKEDHELAARRSKTSYGRPKTTRKPVVIKSKHAPIVIDAKLKLPPLSKVKVPSRDTRSALSENV